MKLRNPYQFFGKIYTISTRSFSLHTKQILEIKLKRNHFQPFFNICFVSNISYFASSGELMGCNYASNNEVVTKEVNRYPQLYSPKSLSSLVGIRSTRGFKYYSVA
jgi:diphthamide synthase subunit DPH2